MGLKIGFERKEIEKSINELRYILIDEYIGKGKRRVIIQDDFGYKYDVDFYNLKKGFKPNFVDTHNPYSLHNISIWLKSNNQNIEICEDNIYKNNMNDLNFHCFICNKKFSTNWNAILQNIGSHINCHDKTKMILRYEEVKKEIEKEGCKLISKEYINQETKLDIKCACGNEYSVSFSNFNHRPQNKCRKCSNLTNSRRLNYDFIYNYFLEKGYTLISKEYFSNVQKLEIVDKEEYKYLFTFGRIHGGSIPQKFAFVNPYTIDNIKTWLEKEDKNIEYVDGKYESAIKKNLLFKCKKCENEWKTSWNSILFSGCPKCAYSKGEELVSKILSKYSVENTPQKTFKECKSVSRLRFDFGVLLDEDNWILIEYQGLQHFQPVSFGGDNDLVHQFELNQIHDNIKREFCKKMNYNLIEIPYWFKNIEIEELLIYQLNL